MANKNKYSYAVEVFSKNSNILRMSEALRLGIRKPVLYDMLSEGLIVREERGLYRLTKSPTLSNPDFVKISLLVPKAVICLTSALYFYNLTTQIPSSVFIALPRNIRFPKVAYPPLDVVWLSPKIYTAGIDIQVLDGVDVRIYDPEKTLADCFKFRSKIGIEIGIEALRDYVKNYRPNVGKIMEYARMNRVERIIRPYLEAFV